MGVSIRAHALRVLSALRDEAFGAGDVALARRVAAFEAELVGLAPEDVSGPAVPRAARR